MNAWQFIDSFNLYKAIALWSEYVLPRHVSIVWWSLQGAVRDLKIKEYLSPAKTIGLLV